MNSAEEKRKVAVALVNLDQAFALYFSIQNSIMSMNRENLRNDPIREAYMKYFDWFSQVDNRDDLYAAAQMDDQIISEYYSLLCSRIGLE